LAAAILANLADLVMFLRASPATVAADELSPLPHLLGPVPGGIAAKLILLAAIGIVVVAFRCRPRVKASLLVLYTVAGVVGAVSGVLLS
jgi:uncharacterized membrane protein